VNNINWIEHVVDFGVILAADVLAAYIAIQWFESHRAEEERRQASVSLNRIYQICSQLLERYTKILEGFAKSDDSAGTGLSRDITDADRNFSELDKDYLFWMFPRGTEFREQYNIIKGKKEALNPRTVGQAREQLRALNAALDKITNNACEMLKPRPSFFQKIKACLGRR
jgi:hypothetical protein